MNSSEVAIGPQGSFMVADCGSSNTTVALFDVASGGYRLLARASALTTAAAPHADICKGIRQAISQITEITGRELLNERGELIKPARRNGAGVDRFTAVVSAAPPLETIIVGLSDDVSVASARRALSRGYAHIVDCITPTDGRDERRRVDVIIEKKPDLILLVGGTDGGAEKRMMRLIDTVSLAVSVLSSSKRPHVLYAGNMSVREWARHALAEHATVQVINNLRPQLNQENLSEAHQVITDLYEKLKINALPGIQRLHDWCNHPLVPAAQSFATVTHYLAAMQAGRVLGIDLGGGSTTFVGASPEQLIASVSTDHGIGRSIISALSGMSSNMIRYYVHNGVTEAEVKDFVWQKSQHPHTVPMTETDLHLELSVARQILIDVYAKLAATWDNDWTQFPVLNMLLLRGRVLTEVPRAGQAILALLDSVQPSGLFSVAWDEHGVLPALGALAAHDPLAVVQALEGGALTSLGWVVAPLGNGQPGQKVLTITMESEQIRHLEVEVAFGTVEVLPLASGQSAEITFEPTRRFDIGFGAGRGKSVTLHGGKVGLVVDARGRPLRMPQDDEVRQGLMRQWLWDVGG